MAALDQPASPERQAAAPPRGLGLRDAVRSGLLCYFLTSSIAVGGVVVGREILLPAQHPLARHGDLWATFANWDGVWYKKVLRSGYTYHPQLASDIAFFPAFPLLGRLLAAVGDLRPEAALLLVSHLCLAAAFVVLAAYLQSRYREQPRAARYALLAFGLFPTTFFFRMAYSESLFLLGTVLALYGMERRWPLPLIAAFIGLTTATRPVGVALLLPLLLHLRERAPTWLVVSRNVLLLPLACWGLLAFMAYQYYAFGEPLAFARTQEHWRMRPAVPLPERLSALARLEPLWSVFDVSSPCYWQRHERQGNPLASLHLVNPLYFLATLILIVVGAWKGWLNPLELTLAAGLLLIPYATRGHEMCMGAMGRFAAVVLPVYLVLGQLLARLPAAVAAMLLGLSGLLMGAYAAYFAAWYRFF